MIRNIIFDIGNVLVDYCWQEHIAHFGFCGELAERIGNAMMQSRVWLEVDRGVWTQEELLKGFVSNAPELEEEIRMVYADLGTLIRERSGSLDWIRSLKAEGYGVYYLSNFSERVKLEASGELSFLAEMDGGVLSYMEHLIKPDRRIYRLLLERYGLSAKESVFLDDTLINVEAARELGMSGILVKSQEQGRQKLQELLKR